MKQITLKPKEKEAIVVSDFIVVKNVDFARKLAFMHSPPDSLKGKMIIVAPEGIEFLQVEELYAILKAHKRKEEYENNKNRSKEKGFNKKV